MEGVELSGQLNASVRDTRGGRGRGVAVDEQQQTEECHIARTEEVFAVEHGAETERLLFGLELFLALVPVSADADEGIAALRPVARWVSDVKAGKGVRCPA